jgi:predicted acetyltransferase
VKQIIGYSAMSQPAEREQLTKILARCFGAPASHWEPYFSRVGPGNFRIVRLGEEIAGGLAIYFMGQWFGGKSMPLAGIAAVGVAPEFRGTGVAFELVARTLRELRESGIPLSALYASTQHLYRRVGYEQAGTRCQFMLPTRSIGTEDRSLPLSAVDPARHEVFHDLYRKRAMRSAGNLDRSQAIWERMVSPHPGADPEELMHAYITGEEGRPEGYVVFTQSDREGGYDLAVRDLVALTPNAARRLLTFFADHRSLARELVWWGPLSDPLACLFPEQDYRVKQVQRWMMRIVDVPKALGMRGYPEDIQEAELHLEVWDDVLPENQGPWVLRVADGQGAVTAGGRGELKLAVSGLATLYSGFLTASQLAEIGFLSGPPHALATATRFFAGPEPWMPDFF